MIASTPFQKWSIVALKEIGTQMQFKGTDTF